MPRVGEVKQEPCGSFSVYALCERCNKPRWTTCKKDGRPLYKLCHKCSQQARIPPTGLHSPAHLVYDNYRQLAVSEGLSFRLGKGDFIRLIQRSCYYCGASPATERKVGTRSFTYSGIERIDNSKGYIRSNMVPCCGNCNRAKSTMTRSEYIQHCKRVVKYQGTQRKLTGGK